MKRSLMLFALILLLVVLISSSAFATLARIRSLGNTDYYFKDIYHIYTNPAWLGMYTNSVYGELGTYDERNLDPYYEYYFQWVPEERFLGINYKVYREFSLSLTLNRKVYLPFYFYEVEPDAVEGTQQPDPEDYINEYDLMASYDFEKLHVGLGFHHEGNKSEGEERNYYPGYYDYTEADEWSIGNTGLTGGFLYDIDEYSLIEGMLRLNFDRYNETYSYSDTAGDWYDEELELQGGNGIGFGVRAFYQVVEDFQIVPLFMFETEKVSLKYTYTDEDTTYSEESGDEKYTKFVIGLGGNLKLDKGMVAGGINLTKEKYVDEWDTTDTWEGTRWFRPGFNLGVEYELTKWLTARMGMEKEFIKYEEEGDYTSYYDTDTLQYTWLDKWSSTTEPSDFLGFGLGFKFSKFKVDATIGSNRFFEGGYILSGRQRNLFGTMSALFEF